MSGRDPLERLAAGEPLYEPEQQWPARVYWIWLAGLLGPASPHAAAVLREYGSARAVYQDRLAVERFAAATSAAAARRLAEQGDTAEECEKILNRCNQTGVRVVTYEDEEYPPALRAIPDPPLVLYCTGDLEWLHAAHTVGVVGSRRPTRYGVEAAAHLGSALAKSGAVIVSGLADGLDSEGHKAAVANDAPTIAVQGVAIDRVYPSTNKTLRAQIERRGVVVSEYAPGQSIGSNGFLQRNRLIAALAQALLVVEARQKSGTMSTVHHAQRYGKPVFAVPGSIFSTLSEGTNELLRSGVARPAVDARDLLTAVGLAAGDDAPDAEDAPGADAAPEKPLSASAAVVLAKLGAKPVGLSALMGAAGLPVGTLLSALTELELAGLVAVLPGRQYVLR